MKKTFLFDIGNVLIGVKFDRFYQQVFGDHEPSDETVAKFIEVRDLNDRGRMGPADFVDSIRSLSPLNPTARQVEEAWNGIFDPIPEMQEVARKLRKLGHRLILFSNTNELHLPFIFENYPILKEFHGAQYSCELGEIKPHDHFYQDAIDRFDLVPGETVYFDDLAENIEGGKRHGFLSHQYDYTDHDQAMKWLAESTGVTL
jgi:putative hydrolase of the HAD superfamily